MVDLSRRAALKSAALLALSGCASAQLRSPTSAESAGSRLDTPAAKPLRLWYREPALVWVEALPIGNGRIGAMVYGGVSQERLQLNEDTFFSGGPYDSDSPEALEALPEVRRLLFAGRYAEAEALANAKLMARPLKQMSYQPIGDVVLDFPALTGNDGYVRELDLDSAIARTRFSSDGVEHVREVFASPVDQVIVLRLSANQPGHISFDLSMKTQQSAAPVVAAGDLLTLSGVGKSERGITGALKFETRAKVSARGGSLQAVEQQLQIRAADEALVLIAIATSYRRYDDVSGDAAAITQQQIAATSGKSFAQLLAAHETEHRRLFHRVAIDLGSTAAADEPTDQRVRKSGERDDPALAALYFQYGRYLLISSSRPGCQPANLQGIWNDRVQPPWESKWTININTEMNYWPAEPTQLGECVQPLVAMVRDLATTGARTARVMYGARGWVVHNNTDLWRAAAPIDGAKWALWPTGGAWLCKHLWDRYDYGRDRAYLAQIYPLLKGCAEFFVDVLVEDPQHRWLVTAPSLSPENVHPHGASICVGPAMDQQILRDVFANCIEAATILGVDGPFRARLTATRARLAPDRIGSAGQLQEWQEDWDMQAPEIHHRHVSHLYAVYPSNQINMLETPTLAAAARRSLEIRGDEATGWGIGWRLNLWARFQDGEHAHEVLQMLLRPERTYPNLFDAHPPFQIDGNFGGTSGIAEMLMQSWGGAIHLLPALPSAWPAGSISGLRARGACSVSLTWQAGKLDEAILSSDLGGKYLVRYGTQQIEVKLGREQRARLRLVDGVLRVA
jgi:alpha-L-fucosidase 2